MLSVFEKCESCGYEHGNIFTGECAACCFFSKYTPKEAPTMWECIKGELNSFAEKWKLKFYTYKFSNQHTYSIRFSCFDTRGRIHGYSKIVNLNDITDWLDFTNKIENEVIEKLDLNNVALVYRTKGDIRCVNDIDESSVYPVKPISMVFDCERQWNTLIAKTMEDHMNTNKTKITGKLPEIKDVIFNNPATIVYWSDGTKTIVKIQGETFDKEKGLAMAISKKFFGNEGNYYEEFKKWIPELKKTKQKSNKVVAEKLTKQKSNAVVAEKLTEKKSNEVVAEKLTGKEMLEDFIKHYPVYDTPGTIIKAVKVPNKNQIVIRTKDGEKFHYDYETKKQILD